MVRLHSVTSTLYLRAKYKKKIAVKTSSIQKIWRLINNLRDAKIKAKDRHIVGCCVYGCDLVVVVLRRRQDT